MAAEDMIKIICFYTKVVVTHLFCYHIGCKNKTRGWYVDIAPEVFEESHGCSKNNQKVCRIWTRKFETGNRDNKDYALVMAHGMGAGGALFALSMDELTTYSTTKNPTRTLSIISIANTASGYSSGVPDSSKDWNSGNVPSTKVSVDTRTTPREVKAMI